MAKIIIRIINFYQLILSPDHGVFSRQPGTICRYFPSCSEYTKEAVQNYGTLKGLWQGVKRVSRCHPWHAGGFDPLP